MKIIHTSDTQIKNWPYGGTNPETGLNRRFEDALACFDYIIDYAIKAEAQYFIHAGDVNEERNPDSIAIEEFAKRVNRITKAGMKFIIVAGNHDADSAKGTTTSISYLKALEIPNVYIADRSVEVFKFDEIGIPVRFLCLPYFYKSQLKLDTHDDVTKYLQDRVKKFWSGVPDDDDFVNICVSHYAVDEVFDFEINEPVLPLKMFQSFDYNAFGHIHQYIDYTDLDVAGGFCGSPYRVNFGEKEKKYFNVIDFKHGDVEKIEIPNRDFVDILIDAREVDQKGIEEYCVNKLRHMDLKDNFLKITIQCYEKFNLRTMYEYLKEKEIFHYEPIKFQKEKVISESRLEYKPAMTDLEVVKAYLEKQKLPQEFKDQVIECVKETINEVETA